MGLCHRLGLTRHRSPRSRAARAVAGGLCYGITDKMGPESPSSEYLRRLEEIHMANLMLRQRVAETVNLVAIRNMNAQEGVTSTGFAFEVVAHRTSFFECVQNYVSDSLEQVLLLASAAALLAAVGALSRLARCRRPGRPFPPLRVPVRNLALGGHHLPRQWPSP